MTDVYSPILSNSCKLEGTACYVGQLLAPAEVLFFFAIFLCSVVTLVMLKKKIYKIQKKYIFKRNTKK